MNAVAAKDAQPLVGIIMGSQSDWATLEHTANMLKQLGVPFEAEVVSAHRTPDRLFEYAETARDRGIQVIIAGAGGAAHLRVCVQQNRFACIGCSSQIIDLKRCRFFAFDCTNACGYCSGYFGDWPGRRNQCSDYGGTDFRADASRDCAKRGGFSCCTNR